MAWSTLTRGRPRLCKIEEGLMLDEAVVSRGGGEIDPYTGKAAAQTSFTAPCRVLASGLQERDTDLAGAGSGSLTTAELRIPLSKPALEVGDGVRVTSTDGLVREYTVRSITTRTVAVSQRAQVELRGDLDVEV